MGYAIPHGAGTVDALRTQIGRLETQRELLTRIGPVEYASKVDQIDREIDKIQHFLNSLPALLLAIEDEVLQDDDHEEPLSFGL